MTRPPTFAERRRALGLTQGQLAALLDVTARQVRAIEARTAPPRRYDLALQTIEARAAAGQLVVNDAPRRGRPQRLYR
jgi:DNA-binding transcriptional regulator YiaG